MTFVTRFAPSPTGPLHLGHAYSALLAHDMARAAGGRFLLRIEDIDRARCRPEWEAQVLDDLTWLGIRWDAPPLRQSARLPAHAAALDDLWARGLLYPCTCTRRDIDLALGAPQEGVPLGPDGPVYPGTCRPAQAPRGPRPQDSHLRLNMRRAATGPCRFTETGPAHARPVETTPQDYAARIGDVVLARRDFGTSYHLSVVLDDAAQGVTHVIRGADLFEATRIHALLQRLLGLPAPVYHHHRLIRDDAGKRLAKRDDARALAKYRAEGATPEDIRRMTGL
ncbi:tRNA glutamyl-Q(34) synthetase GluQRS [Xinfangfangia sp. LG-4]|uniref:tRNA glutamyl-Q(34) synthetase GluQRS n=1 Tax=Ruixingdingia sedimenti TaxID=3073604 RepID=A0ABU1F5E3_9RHOB|nr:tRNA glutamyl-Q(34) synthetase GluQRS [Xinfangfangia sp. LG-4]MDR5651647.1 tRNA glutamyl-Q(34) synthetase GluQRS [Xinfangfangia sp. LG-4]